MAPFASGGFRFESLRELLAKANEPKSGDALAGLAAGSAEERVAAKRALADAPLRRFVEDLTRVNKGQAYFASPDDLGGAVFVDFLRNRRRKA